MAAEILRDPDFEWLDMLQPTGLVVGRNLLRELGLVPERQTQVQSAEAAAYIEEDTDQPALKEPWAFVADVLGWEVRHVAGTLGGPPLPDALTVRLPGHDTTLAPTWAVNELGRSDQPWQLLAWGRLLALFRLIHKGHPSHFVQARGGKLFDPNAFPFLEGRDGLGDPPRVLAVSDGTILRILEGLMTLKGPNGRERLSYRSLDVEQIGSVYEIVMGFSVETASGGYPASSLKERVYAYASAQGGIIDCCGLLIYTASAGAQGTLGGLVSIAPRFSEILTAALRRAEICSNDPICADHEPDVHTADRATHGAACHGCLLVADTSCEARNLFLDRNLLVDTMSGAGAAFFVKNSYRLS
jgi:hypothetical protein